jgi:small subunit ribosomal protein S17
LKRGRRKEKIGIVVSDAMDKTRTIRVERTIRHPLYDKVVRQYAKFKAHDEKNESHAGDRVRIVETRPLSKTKRWRLVGIVEKSSRRS